MKLLLVGGSGMVGTFITPYLARHHTLRVLDLRPPSADGVEYVEGSITDPGTVRRALEGCGSFINLVMNGAQGGASTDQSIPLILSNYEVNTVGLHLLLYIAQDLGIRRGVHTSTMSVHYRDRLWYHQEEDVPLDTPSVTWILTLSRPVGIPWRFAAVSVGPHVLQHRETAFGGAHPPHPRAQPAIVRQVLRFVTTGTDPETPQQLLYGRQERGVFPGHAVRLYAATYQATVWVSELRGVEASSFRG